MDSNNNQIDFFSPRFTYNTATAPAPTAAEAELGPRSVFNYGDEFRLNAEPMQQQYGLMEMNDSLIETNARNWSQSRPETYSRLNNNSAMLEEEAKWTRTLIREVVGVHPFMPPKRKTLATILSSADGYGCLDTELDKLL